ncbi:hypothetical protein ABKN59_007011 [Abortiporus biennis]
MDTPLLVSDSMASKGITVAVSVSILLIGIAYCIGIYFLYQYVQKNPKALNRQSSLLVFQCTLVAYISLALFNFMELASTVWLLAQYHHVELYPTDGTLTGIQLSLFSSCWTIIFSTLYAILLGHPILSSHPLASIGSQAVWLLTTWCLWVASLAILNRDLGVLDLHADCSGVLFCGQLRAVAAFALIDILIISAGMCLLGYLIYQKSWGNSWS